MIANLAAKIFHFFINLFFFFAASELLNFCSWKCEIIIKTQEKKQEMLLHACLISKENHFLCILSDFMAGFSKNITAYCYGFSEISTSRIPDQPCFSLIATNCVWSVWAYCAVADATWALVWTLAIFLVNSRLVHVFCQQLRHKLKSYNCVFY